MFNLDPAKIVVIMALALIVMGPEKMQSSARRLGALWRTVGEMREKVEHQVRDAIPDLDLPRLPSSPRGIVSSYVSDMLVMDHSSSLDTPPGGPIDGSEEPDQKTGGVADVNHFVNARHPRHVYDEEPTMN